MAGNNGQNDWAIEKANQEAREARRRKEEQEREEERRRRQSDDDAMYASMAVTAALVAIL